MSQTAAYRALGQGLLFAGQDLAARRDENARGRREASLLQLRRAWQMDDREAAAARQDELLAEQRRESDRAMALERGFARQDRDEERRYEADIYEERERPVQEARTGLLEAQTQYYQDRGQQTLEKGVFGVVRPDAYTPESLQAFQNQFQATGQKNWSLLEPRSELNEAQRIEAEIKARAASLAEDFLPLEDYAGRRKDPVRNLVQKQPEQAEAFGVQEGDSYPAALRKIQESISEELLRPGAQGQGGAGLLGGEEATGRTPEDPIPAETLQGPPEPGTYVVRDGEVLQWDGQRLIRVR